MTQAEFSKSVEAYLVLHHPSFISSIEYKDDGSFDCLTISKNAKLAIWVATYHLEMTVGFEDNGGNFDSHWHLGRIEEVELSDLLKDMSRFITEIITDKVFIAKHLETGYHIYKSLEEILKIESRNHVIKASKWSDY